MIRHGDTVINFSKVKGTQLATIQTVIRKRPKTKFSTGLSLEAQEAMQQVVEDSRIEQNARRGKRGSKGNVLFADTVQIRRGSTTKTLGFLDVAKDNSMKPLSPRSSRADGGSKEETILSRGQGINVTVPATVGRPGSVSLAVDQVEMANRPGVVRDRKTSRVEDGKKEGRRK